MEELNGVIENIVFRNDENGYTVAEARVEGGVQMTLDGAGSAEFNLVTVVGTLPPVSPGTPFTMTGSWTEHRVYGRQFKISDAVLKEPAGLDAIERYLASGTVKGVREATARAIVRRFGEDALRIIEEEPERLAELKGISMRKAMEIHESFEENRGMREVMVKLSGLGLTPKQSVKLYNMYGPAAPNIVQLNPYQLIEDIDGIGFKTADAIAQNAGIAADSPFRIEAGVLYSLKLAAAEGGHTCLPVERLTAFAAHALGCEQSEAEERLFDLASREKLVLKTLFSTEGGSCDAAFLPPYFAAENAAAGMLLSLLQNGGDAPAREDAEELAALEEKKGICLDTQQRRAVLAALQCGVLVVTGGPGTGKTTIMEFVLALLSRGGVECELCAPTGRAAKRLSEATGCDARTIHRLLEYNGEEFLRDEDAPLEADVFIVDEASMIDSLLFYRFLKALPQGARLILVGDADQLPSVGAGNVLRDVIRTGVLPVVRLQEVFRQGKRSRIALNAQRINHGEMPLLEFTGDFAFEERTNPQDVQRRVINMLQNGRLGDPFCDVQVLSPTKKGTLGVNSMNLCIQAALNPPAPGKREARFGDRIFRVGDKVMQIKNDYQLEWSRPALRMDEREGTGVFNGDMGTIMGISERSRTVEVLFDDERTVHYDFADMAELELAYCISVHKSQGSEFPVVILPLCGGPPLLMTRNLLYTALTRARNRVVIVGRQQSIHDMVENNEEQARYSALAPLIQQKAEIRGLNAWDWPAFEQAQ